MRRFTAFIVLATALISTGCSASSGVDTAPTTAAAPSASASPTNAPQAYELGQTFNTHYLLRRGTDRRDPRRGTI